ncbi:MAG: hypothetical protein ACRD8U_02015 [Pyrinomonadaceae bacterium]
MERAIRGSWKYDDFHLSRDGTQTRSDLDLVVEGASQDLRTEYKTAIQLDLEEKRPPLRVSIHAADSLLTMNLDDSFFLNIGEFIAKTNRLKPGEPAYDYTLAKISLLLLRRFPQERYVDVSSRAATPEVEMALGVKLGYFCAFSNGAAATLLSCSQHSTVRLFVQECVVKRASQEFIDFICQRVRFCKSIDPWLQDYLISKVNGTNH